MGGRYILYGSIGASEGEPAIITGGLKALSAGFWAGFSDIADTDGDGVPDASDICPGFDDKLDTDGDEVPDDCDVCLEISDPNQTDTDADGIGDACECSRVNLDGFSFVNLPDCAVLESQWMMTGAGLLADTNRDLQVDILDLYQILQHWLDYCDATPPVVELLSDMFTNEPDYTLIYSVDGVEQTESLELTEGDNIIQRTFQDAAGNETTIQWTVVLDTTAPAGSIIINNNDTYTSDPNIILTLTGSDAGSGIDQMSFSNDGGTNWTLWESFSSVKNLTLTEGEGLNEVRYRLRDLAGNSAGFLDTIILDVTSPIGTIVIDGGAAEASSRNVILTLTASDNISSQAQIEMAFSQDGGSFTAFEPFNATKNITLTGTNGTKTITVRYQDEAGNTDDSSDDIILTVDEMPPSGSVIINGGDTHTNSANVTLSLDVSDETTPDPNIQMAFSEDGVNFDVFESFTTSRSFTLTGGDGTNTVTVRYRDEAGNTADFSDSAVLDTTSPSGTIVIDGGATETSSANVTLDLTVSDNVSPEGQMQMAFSEDGVDFGAFEPFSATKSFTLTGPDGTNTVTVRYQDEAGNTFDVSDDIILNSIPPVPITLVGDAHIDNSTFKFGGGSAAFDGNGDYITTPSSDNYNFGTGDFTIDMWVRFNTIAGEQELCSRDESIRITRSAGNGGLIVRVNGLEHINTAWTPSTNTWYHVAVSRSGGNLRAFIDGTQIGSTVSSSDDMTDSTAFEIGRGAIGHNNYVNGWIDEFRMSKDVARWTSNFTPPSGEYASDANTVLLLHFNSN